MIVNTTQPIGSRIVSVDVLCTKCSPQRYEPIDVKGFYRVLAPNYLAEGGDGYIVFADNKRNYRLLLQWNDCVTETGLYRWNCAL